MTETENEYQYIPSDRIELLQVAVNFMALFQKEDSAISPEPTAEELKVYSAALKLLEKEFKRGASVAELVTAKQTIAAQE